MSIHTNADSVKRLLQQIPAACSRNDWVKTLGAIKNAITDGRDIAEEWSRTAPDQFDSADFDRTWNSLVADRGARGTATLGSLIHIAAHGHSGGMISGSTGDPSLEPTEDIEPARFETARRTESPPPPGDPSTFDLRGEKPTTTPESERTGRGKITERYKIYDWDGTHVATHLRFEDGGRPWVAPDNNLPLKPKTDVPWYNSHLLIMALAQNRDFFITMVEGEKATRALQSCFRGEPGDPIVIGTYGTTWRPLDSHIARLIEILDKIDSGKQADAEIICWADNDKVGREHMEGMIALLHEAGYPKPIKMIVAGRGKGYDAADWVENKQNPSIYELHGRAKTYHPPQYIVHKHPKYGKRESLPPASAELAAPAKSARVESSPTSESEPNSPPPPRITHVSQSDPAHGGKILLSSKDEVYGFRQALHALDIHVRYDTLREDYEYRYRKHDNDNFIISLDRKIEHCEWRNIDNLAYRLIQSFIATHCVTQIGVDSKGNPNYKRAKFSMQDAKECLDSCAQNEPFNPVTNWLETELPQWDGKSRMTTFLEDMFGCGDKRGPLMNWASVYIPMAIVHRAYQPGYQLPYVVILIGAQGTGKSELLKQLIPPKYRDYWFNDTFYLHWDRKYQREAILGRVLVEFADMAGLRKAESDQLKAFITSSDDGGMRDPYSRRPTASRPRTAIMIGTSDRTEDSSLPFDSAGYRRFVPVVFAHGCNVQQYMDTNRDQIFAEALHYYHNGLDPRIMDDFTKQLQGESTQEQAPSNEVAETLAIDLHALIASHFGCNVPTKDSALKLIDIMKAMGMDDRSLTNVGVQRRVASDIRKLGWKSMKNARRIDHIKKGRSRVGNWWIAPDQPE